MFIYPSVNFISLKRFCIKFSASLNIFAYKIRKPAAGKSTKAKKREREKKSDDENIFTFE